MTHGIETIARQNDDARPTELERLLRIQSTFEQQATRAINRMAHRDWSHEQLMNLRVRADVYQRCVETIGVQIREVIRQQEESVGKDASGQEPTESRAGETAYATDGGLSNS